MSVKTFQDVPLTADGSTAATEFRGSPVWFYTDNDLGGGTMTYEYMPDVGSDWKTCGSITDVKDDVRADLPRSQIRATLSGSTNPNATPYWTQRRASHGPLSATPGDPSPGRY